MSYDDKTLIAVCLIVCAVILIPLLAMDISSIVR